MSFYFSAFVGAQNAGPVLPTADFRLGSPFSSTQTTDATSQNNRHFHKLSQARTHNTPLTTTFTMSNTTALNQQAPVKVNLMPRPCVVPASSSSCSLGSDASSHNSCHSPHQQRTYYWHAGAATSPSLPMQPSYGSALPDPYRWPVPPATNATIEAMQAEVHKWRSYAEGWQRHCEDMNHAHQQEMENVVKTVQELQRQKKILVERARRYKAAATAGAAAAAATRGVPPRMADGDVHVDDKDATEEENSANAASLHPTPDKEASSTSSGPKSILRKASLIESPRPLKKRRVRPDYLEARCASPKQSGNVKNTPPMPVTPPMPSVHWADLS